MTLDAARKVADAVLYEGYLLYPYRASAAKNQVRWQFGVLGPEGAAAAGVGEEPTMFADVLLEGSGGRLDLHLRFLQVQVRTVDSWTGQAWVPVPSLTVGDARWIPFHEARPQEVTLSGLAVEDQQHAVVVAGGSEVEELHDQGRLVGRLVRTREELHGTVTLTTQPALDPRLVVVRLQVDNRTSWTLRATEGWAERDVAARSSFVGTHVLATATGARWLSLLDPPPWAKADAAACRQHRCWPGLIADDAAVDALLLSPIVLGDHPTIAPESSGDLFDATEIDEILTLRVMTMTDGEKQEARGTDPRAAAIVDRCDAMTDDERDLLHGARRDDLDAGAQPEKDVVMVRGVPVSKGSRVLLRPTRRADAHDLFLAGMSAVVERVYVDLDDNTHLAVALEDDPGADLYATTGRFYYFAPDEVEPLPAAEGSP